MRKDALTLALALLVSLALPATAGALDVGVPGVPGVGPPGHAEITSGPLAKTKSRTARFEFKASSSVLLSYFECRLDEGTWERCSSPRTYTELTGGTHTFEVRLFGVVALPTPAKFTWVVDLQTTTSLRCGTTCTNPPPAPNTPVGTRRNHYAVHGCAYGGARASQATQAQLVRATECLINFVRRRLDRHGTTRNAALRLIANRQAADMVRRHYFAHGIRGRSTLPSRARPYFQRVGPGDVGEILGWGSGPRSTPASVTFAWLLSPVHREIMLAPRYREIGAGVKLGRPSGPARNAATYAVEFGKRG